MVLYGIVSYGIVLYHMVLYCIAWYCIVLYHMVLYRMVDVDCWCITIKDCTGGQRRASGPWNERNEQLVHYLLTNDGPHLGTPDIWLFSSIQMFLIQIQIWYRFGYFKKTSILFDINSPYGISSIGHYVAETLDPIFKRELMSQGANNIWNIPASNMSAWGS